MRLYLFIIILLVTQKTLCQKQYDTASVFFPLNGTQLDEKGTKLIDSLINKNILRKQLRIILLGYGDYLGSEDYNKTLSLARAKNVEEHLLLLPLLHPY